MSSHYTMDEIAEFLGIKYYRIAYQHRIGALAEPTKVGGRRAYTQKDLRRVAEHFGVPVPEWCPMSDPEPEGGREFNLRSKTSTINHDDAQQPPTIATSDNRR